MNHSKHMIIGAAISLITPLTLLCFVTMFVSAYAGTFCFHKRVSWKAGRKAQAWETVVSPTGKERYRLAVIPLWAVEGGVVGIEVLVAHQETPNDNLLGKRDTNTAQPFVITVEELESGIHQSPFGASRVFVAGPLKLKVDILATWRTSRRL